MVDIENITKEFEKVLGSAAKKNEKFIVSEIQKTPARLKTAAIAFTPKTGLKRRSGRLIGSIEGFLRKISSKEFVLGLKAGGEVAAYAKAQHDGAIIPSRFIKPRVAKALSWMQGGKRRFSKGHRVKGFKLKARKYLIDPLIVETRELTKRLLKGIGL